MPLTGDAPTASPIPIPTAAPTKAVDTQANMIEAAVTAAKAAVDQMSAQVANAVPAVTGVPEAQVAERLEAVKQWAAQQLKAKDDEEKLKFKSYELDTQAQLTKQKDDLEKGFASEKNALEQARAEEEATEKQTKADEQAAHMVAKVKLDAEKASVTAELAAAAASKRDADAEKAKATQDITDANEKVEKSKQELDDKKESFGSEKEKIEESTKLIREKDEKSNSAEVKSAVATNVAEVRSEMTQKAAINAQQATERRQKSDQDENGQKANAATEISGKKAELDSYKDKKREMEQDLAAANKKIGEESNAELKTKGEMKLAVDQAGEDSTAKITANEIEAKSTATAQVQEANLAKERSSELLRKKLRVENEAEGASVEASQKSAAKTLNCKSELAHMRTTATAEEKIAASEASELEDATEANAHLQQKVDEWKTKIDNKVEECTTKTISYTQSIGHTEIATVQAPAGPDEEETVELIQMDESELPPADPWPLDAPLKPTNADGSPGVSVPFQNENQRLMESNGAAVRGYTAIESGARSQIGYFKFPVPALKAGETINSAILKFEKKGGPEADCVVKLTTCDYDSAALTYDNRPAGSTTASFGGAFPAGDGPADVELDTAIITTELNKNPADSKICLEITGGQQNDPDLIDDVNLSIKITREGQNPALTDADKLPTPTIDRRRRSTLNNARRRRSVQGVKDYAKTLAENARQIYNTEYSNEMTAKVPERVAAKKLVVENELRSQYEQTIRYAVRAKIGMEFSRDKELERSEKARTKQVKTAIDMSFPSKYAQEKEELAERMRKDVTKRMTNEEERLISVEAQTQADNTIKSDSQSLLQGAVLKKVEKDYPKAMQQALESKAPKDFTTAISLAVTASVTRKSQEAIDKAVNDEINNRLSLQEKPAAMQAAQAAVASRLAELMTSAVSAKKAECTTSAAPCGEGIKQLCLQGGANCDTQIAALVAAGPSPLGISEKRQIENAAASSAVAALKQSLQQTVPDEVKTVSFVENVVNDLKGKETKRLTPIVKSDILKNLQAELAVSVKQDVTKRANEYVSQQKDSVLKILLAALVQKNKVDLLPAMNAKLSTSVPMELNSAKFEAQVTAAQLELKETLRSKMQKELEAPLEKVAKLQIQEEEKAKKEEITMQVRLAEDAKLKDAIDTQTTTDEIQPGVEAEMERQKEKKVNAAVNKKVKKDVDETLGPQLKLAIHAKYYKGTLANSKTHIMENDEAEIRNEITIKFKARADRTAMAKGVGAKEALLKTLREQLQETIYNQLAAEGADQLSADTEGMSVADRKAMELHRQQIWKLKSEGDAEKQAQVEVAGQSGDEIVKRLKKKEEIKAQKSVDAEVAKQVVEKAKILTQQTLDNLYNDDLKAMEEGHNHVSDTDGQAENPLEGEVNGPDVGKTAMLNAANTTVVPNMAEDPMIKNAASGLAATPATALPEKPTKFPNGTDTTAPTVEADTTAPAVGADTTAPAQEEAADENPQVEMLTLG